MRNLEAAADPVFPEVWSRTALSDISDVIENSLSANEPPFLQRWYGDRYREFALNPSWLAHSFVANAEKEAEGARKLWQISGAASQFPFSGAIAQHAKDEARHARMYVAMLDLAFPEALDSQSRKQLLSSFPNYQDSTPEDQPPRSIESLLDDLVQMNIGEIRTRIHQMLLRPVASAVAPIENRQRLGMILERIYDDEGNHIVYTAEILNAYCQRGYSDLIKLLYITRLKDFSQITLEEVGAGNFD